MTCASMWCICVQNACPFIRSIPKSRTTKCYPLRWGYHAYEIYGDVWSNIFSCHRPFSSVLVSQAANITICTVTSWHLSYHRTSTQHMICIINLANIPINHRRNIAYRAMRCGHGRTQQHTYTRSLSLSTYLSLPAAHRAFIMNSKTFTFCFIGVPPAHVAFNLWIPI